MIFILIRQGYREVSISVLIFAGCLQRIFTISIFPLLGDQAKYTAACHFSFILVVFLYEGIFIKQTLSVHAVQPTEIFFFLRAFVVKLSFVSFRIYIVFTVIRCACCSEGRVRNRNHDLPVIGIQRERNRRLSIGFRMQRHIILQHFLIVGQSLHFRITQFLQYAVLNFKTACCVEGLLANTHVCRNLINTLVIQAVFQAVHVLAIDFLEIRSILIDQIGQINNQTGIHQRTQTSFGKDQIGNVAAGSHHRDFLVAAAAAYIKFSIDRYTGLLSNYFTDIILHFIPVRTGICTKE
ncbi:hypothetical protein D3C75_611790 [compost metagenome]